MIPRFAHIAATVIAVSLFLSGCLLGTRIECCTDISGSGRYFKTRYKYSIAKYSLSDDVRQYYIRNQMQNQLARIEQEQGQKLNRLFAKFQPGVFASDGLPVDLQELPQRHLGEEASKWNILSVFTFCLVPLMFSNSYENEVRVGLPDHGGISAKVKYCSTLSQAMTFPIIPPRWAIGDAPKGNNAVGKYSTSGYYETTLGGGTFPDNQNASAIVLAYAVAAKVKSMEDSGAVDKYIAMSNKRHMEPTPKAVQPRQVVQPQPQVLNQTINNNYYIQIAMPQESNEPELTLKVEDYYYDNVTRRGKFSVRFGDCQLDQLGKAREYIRKNIEKIVCDKNIVLETGTMPPPGRYRSLGEKKNGNILEIEFEAE